MSDRVDVASARCDAVYLVGDGWESVCCREIRHSGLHVALGGIAWRPDGMKLDPEQLRSIANHALRACLCRGCGHSVVWHSPAHRPRHGECSVEGCGCLAWELESEDKAIAQWLA
jgi:hypothetical protein